MLNNNDNTHFIPDIEISVNKNVHFREKITKFKMFDNFDEMFFAVQFIQLIIKDKPTVFEIQITILGLMRRGCLGDIE